MYKKYFFNFLASHVSDIARQEINQGFWIEFAQVWSKRTHSRAQFCHDHICLGGLTQGATQIDGHR